MRFTITAAVSTFLLAASAVSALTVQEARELRPHLDEYRRNINLEGRDDGSSDGLAKRNFCTDHWKTCENCFEKYPYCHMDNIPSSINCLATCSSCPGDC
jgi:hypothetical protein